MVVVAVGNLPAVVVEPQEVSRHEVALDFIACAGVSGNQIIMNRKSLHWIHTIRYLWIVLLTNKEFYDQPRKTMS